MKTVSLKQSHAVMSILAQNVDWEALDGEALQRAVVENPTEAGKQFTLFLQRGARVKLGDLTITPITFNLNAFMGSGGWSLVREDHDPRNDDLKEVDFSKVEFVTCPKEGETRITGEEKLKCLKDGNHVRLGASTFLGLWKDYRERGVNSVLEVLYCTKGITYLDFFGDVLQGPRRDRCVICLSRNNIGVWEWDFRWLAISCEDNSVSAVLPIA